MKEYRTTSEWWTDLDGNGDRLDNIPDPVVPVEILEPGESPFQWSLVNTTAVSGRLFWTWERDVPVVNERKPEDPGNETWFCCECVGDCSKVGSGVVFDVRIDNSVLDVPPFITCPICGEQARIGGKQPSDKDGYGSRADDVRLQEFRREAILAAAADRVEEEIGQGNDRLCDSLRKVIMEGT